jgi:hypothetical protein
MYVRTYVCMYDRCTGTDNKSSSDHPAMPVASAPVAVSCSPSAPTVVLFHDSGKSHKVLVLVLVQPRRDVS